MERGRRLQLLEERGRRRGLGGDARAERLQAIVLIVREQPRDRGRGASAPGSSAKSAITPRKSATIATIAAATAGPTSATGGGAGGAEPAPPLHPDSDSNNAPVRTLGRKRMRALTS